MRRDLRGPWGALLATAWLVAGAPADAAGPQADPLPPAAARSRIVYPADRTPDLQLPGGERREVRSLLAIRRPLKYGEFVWDDPGADKSPVWAVVDLDHQLISVFRGRDEIGTAVIMFGAQGKFTPKGVFPVLSKDKDHVSSTYAARMPFALRLTSDGVAIHGSDVRQGWATHGCIGVPLAFAHALFDVMPKGGMVFIR